MQQEDILRYSRQIILDEIGLDGQEKLGRAKVLVIGCGGLGSPALYYLTAAGIGMLGIVDFDTVGISNLQRQIVHSTQDIGHNKVDSARETLHALNPNVQIQTYPFRIHEDNIRAIINEYDIIIDAVDNLSTRYLINDCCFFLKKPLIEAGILGFNGILMTIIPGKSPCFRCLYPNVKKEGVIPSCATQGVIGMTAGVLGSLQALEALKWILGIGETASGRIVVFNGLTLEFDTPQLERKSDCPLCGDYPVITDLIQQDFICKLPLINEL